MNFRVYNTTNYNKEINQLFPTYFKTKKLAMEYAQTIPNATVEKKLCARTWVLVKQF